MVLFRRNCFEPRQDTTIGPAASNSTCPFGNADVTQMPRTHGAATASSRRPEGAPSPLTHYFSLASCFNKSLARQSLGDGGRRRKSFLFALTSSFCLYL